MRQQPVNVRRIGGRLGVVPVMGMAGGAEHARRQVGRHLHFARAQQQRIRPSADVARILDQHLDRFLVAAGDEQAQAIEDAAPRDAAPLRSAGGHSCWIR